MRDSSGLYVLYRTVPGRALLKLLVQPQVSVAAGKYLSSGASRWLVPYYIWKHRIDMEGTVIPQGGFRSFNEFFTRKRLQTTCIVPSPDALISPCDAYLSCIKIRDNTVFDVKHTEFSLEDLLHDKNLAARFRDGMALIFRLTPAHYHRYCHAADGTVRAARRIRGVLHCVRPVAVGTVPVFAQNSREYQVIRTKRFGTIVQMEIGALLVGKIHNHNPLPGVNVVRAGSEKGYFEFGGSTIVLLLQKDAAHIAEPWRSRESRGGEIPVRMGDVIGYAFS